MWRWKVEGKDSIEYIWSTSFELKNKQKIVYPNLDSGIRPVPHHASLPVPVPRIDGLDSIGEEESGGDNARASGGEQDHADDDYTPSAEKAWETFTQAELNDLIRELFLSKEKVELLGSSLKQKHLLATCVKVCQYKKDNHDLAAFFIVDGPLCYCHNVSEVFEILSQPHVASDWRLFIDSSKRSLKAVLLHNGNQRHAYPLLIPFI